MYFYSDNLFSRPVIFFFSLRHISSERGGPCFSLASADMGGPATWTPQAFQLQNDDSTFVNMNSSITIGQTMLHFHGECAFLMDLG